MSHLRKIEPNVWAFLESAGALYGRLQAEAFSGRMYVEMIERGIESPIEDMVYIALNLQCYARSIDVNEPPDFIDGQETYLGPSIFIKPQAKVGDYRVDFLVVSQNEPDRQAIVELDGHAFHDKDKRQRSYEKGRDRAFVKGGFQVLHYTGSDVVADPHRVAFDVLELLGFTEAGETYDPTNPVGVD